MPKFVWKENVVISLHTMDGIYVLAQTLKAPYLIFFNLFSTTDSWDDIALSNENILFVNGVTRQFIKESFSSRPVVKPLLQPLLPSKWIAVHADAEKKRIWEGTPQERSIVYIGKGGGSLIERDITIGGNQNERVLIPHISQNDAHTIDSYELTSLGTHPDLNERLHLCYRLRRNVDPSKDLIFDRPISPEYQRYFDLLCG